MSDQYRTIEGRASVEIRVERSVFIGHAAPAPDEETARQFVAEIRELHRQATHNPFAYVVDQSGRPVTYYHDHGEPGGTAGKPILGAISRLELTDAAVVVTRYFGGKKLGVRGLIEAYGGAASRALEAAHPAVLTRMASLDVIVDYGAVDQVLYTINKNEAEIVDRQFAEHAAFRVRLACSKVPGLRQALEPLALAIRNG